jgi:hypothetical protein
VLSVRRCPRVACTYLTSAPPPTPVDFLSFRLNSRMQAGNGSARAGLLRGGVVDTHMVRVSALCPSRRVSPHSRHPVHAAANFVAHV